MTRPTLKKLMRWRVGKCVINSYLDGDTVVFLFKTDGSGVEAHFDGKTPFAALLAAYKHWAKARKGDA